MNQAPTGMALPGAAGRRRPARGFGGGAGGEVAERGPEGAREIGLGEEGFVSFFSFLYLFLAWGCRDSWSWSQAVRQGDDDNISPFLAVGLNI
jgi:hypothetical protein